VVEVCVAALPMMAFPGIGELIITHVLWLTTGILEMLGRRGAQRYRRERRALMVPSVIVFLK
jgi:hypothetical protein